MPFNLCSWRRHADFYLILVTCWVQEKLFFNSSYIAFAEFVGVNHICPHFYELNYVTGGCLVDGTLAEQILFRTFLGA